MIYKIKNFLFLFLMMFFISNIFAYESLFYYEIQAVGGYDTIKGKNILYSFDQDDVMQKPSIGFDYIGRISGKTGGDRASIFLQTRLAYSDESLELQIYNAYINLKSHRNNIWFGHDRPSFGLSSVFDIHGLIMPTLVMYGYGFDRDWGVGIKRDTEWGNVAFSLTSGSGMPLYTDGNYFAAARISKGVLYRDNYEAGLSFGNGQLVDIMGYHRMSDTLIPFNIVCVDYTFLWNQFSIRSEYMTGLKDEKNIQAIFARFGISLFDNGLIELQPTYIKDGSSDGLCRAIGFSYQLTESYTLRLMYNYNPLDNDESIIMQWYIYNRL